MKGIADTEPAGIAGDCFWVLLMYADDAGVTTAGLHEYITAEHGSLGLTVPTRTQVRLALRGLACRKPPLVRQEGRGRGTRARWHITDHGYKMLDVWVPDGDGPEPARRPCGLGWPRELCSSRPI